MTYHRGIGDVPDGVCWTCRQHTARYIAVHPGVDSWPVCESCRRMGVKFKTPPIVYTPLLDDPERLLA